MKKIIDIAVKTRLTGVDLSGYKTDLIAVALFSDHKKQGKVIENLDRKLGGVITKLLALGDFKAKENQTAILYSNGKITAERILLIGLGEKKDISFDTIRKVAATAAKKAVVLKTRNLLLAIHSDLPEKFDPAGIGRTLAEAACFGAYSYDEYLTKTKNHRPKKIGIEIAGFDSRSLKLLAQGAKYGAIVGQSQNFARTIANRPGNVINPGELANIAKKVAKNNPALSCTVFDEKQLKQKKMGGILAVGSGSKSPPRLIVLKYSSKKKTSRNIALVGKAITFDSGGISIKPSAGMQDMKFDKSGGIAVIGAVNAIAQLKPDINVYGIIPSAENMPGPTSYRPGDIVTTFSGKTVEVQNTDAEGRMILCDALHYAVTQKCEAIVDIATLTGACMVALGKYKAGLMGNDDQLIKKLQTASDATGEKIWHMPSGDEYLEEMKSKIADLKNIGSRWGGACTAAAFLSQFIGQTKWAHIDMAGVDLFDADNKSANVGSTGFGVRLLTEFVIEKAKSKE